MIPHATPDQCQVDLTASGGWTWSAFSQKDTADSPAPAGLQGWSFSQDGVLSLADSLWPCGARPAHFLSLEDSGHLVSPEVLGGFPEPAGSMKCRAHGAVPSLPSESGHFRARRSGTHFRVPLQFAQPVLLGRQAACLGDRIT